MELWRNRLSISPTARLQQGEKEHVSQRQARPAGAGSRRGPDRDARDPHGHRQPLGRSGWRRFFPGAQKVRERLESPNPGRVSGTRAGTTEDIPPGVGGGLARRHPLRSNRGGDSAGVRGVRQPATPFVEEQAGGQGEGRRESAHRERQVPRVFRGNCRRARATTLAVEPGRPLLR